MGRTTNAARSPRNARPRTSSRRHAPGPSDAVGGPDEVPRNPTSAPSEAATTTTAPTRWRTIRGSGTPLGPNGPASRPTERGAEGEEVATVREDLVAGREGVGAADREGAERDCRRRGRRSRARPRGPGRSTRGTWARRSLLRHIATAAAPRAGSTPSSSICRSPRSPAANATAATMKPAPKPPRRSAVNATRQSSTVPTWYGPARKKSDKARLGSASSPRTVTTAATAPARATAFDGEEDREHHDRRRDEARHDVHQRRAHADDQHCQRVDRCVDRPERVIGERPAVKQHVALADGLSLEDDRRPVGVPADRVQRGEEQDHEHGHREHRHREHREAAPVRR